MSQINTNFAQLLGDNVAQFEGAMELNALAQGSVKSTFDIQVKLSLKMHLTYQWWKSAEGKQAMEYAGIVMTTEEFRDVWGYKRMSQTKYLSTSLTLRIVVLEAVLNSLKMVEQMLSQKKKVVSHQLP